MPSREELRKMFFTRVPKAREINPVFRTLFEFIYNAHLASKGKDVLNIYSSHDFSGNREEVYREQFFREANYIGVDFWEDRFILEEGTSSEGAHTLPFPDSSFDLLITTKVIMEHISEPMRVIEEFHRVLRPGGEAFLIVPLVRRQHQKPHDYFRYTEFGISHLLRKAGFVEVGISYSNGFLATVAAYAYFWQRGLDAPKWAEGIFDWIYAWIVEPLLYTLDRLDNGYGRDFTQYFYVRAKKSA